MKFPRDGEDYPLWLLLATKQALYRCMEDPELADARVVLEKIDEALKSRVVEVIPGFFDQK